ncbi:MAG: choice-of-anchor D domain-containing protein [Candidatus Hatepunaea meridiana]|nr:choice-of-anchor D domain-containing protein [Candidatus Hatepunaea meridiana]
MPDPEEVSWFHTPGQARDVVVSGDYVCAAVGENGLVVIDISDPDNPNIVGSFDTPGIANGVTLIGEHAYIGDGENGLLVINVSDPENPDLVYSKDTPGFTTNIVVHGDYAFAADGNNGLIIFDVSDYLTPQDIEVSPEAIDFGDVIVEFISERILTISNEGDYDLIVSEITVEGDYFTTDFEEELVIERHSSHQLTVTFTPEEGGDLEGILTITSNDPDTQNITISLQGIGILLPEVVVSPEELDFGEVVIGRTEEMILNIGNEGDGILIVSDITVNGNGYNVDFENEIVVQSNENYELTVSFAPDEQDEFEGVLTIVSNDPENEEIDISLLGSGKSGVGHYDTPGVAQDVFVAGEIAYVADYRSGIRLIDISNPEHPEEVGFYNTPGRAYSIFVVENIAYVADWNRGLRLIDVSDPEDLDEISHFDNEGNVLNVFVSDDVAYIGTTTGLRLIDVSDPENPSQIGVYEDDPGFAQDVFVQDNYAYLATTGNWGSDFRILDVSNPGQLELIGTVDAHDAYGLFVTDGIAYVADGNDGLQIIDVSDPEHPEIIASYDANGGAWDVFITDNVAYTGWDLISDFRLIDVTDPEYPSEAYNYDAPGRIKSVFVANGFAYVAIEGRGLRIYDTIEVPLQADIDIYNDMLDFDEELINNDDQLGLTIYNDGNTDLILTDIEIEGDYFSCDVEENPCINPDDSYDLIVSFTPSAIGEYVGSLTIASNDPNEVEKTISLSGKCVSPEIEVSPQSLDFDEGFVSFSKRLTLTIANLGDADLIVSDIVVENDYFNTDFEDELVIEPEENYEIDITFSPQVVGEFNTRLLISSSDPDEAQVIVNITSHAGIPEISEDGYYDTDGRAYGVVVSGDLAFVADYTNGLRIIDISNLAEPQEVGSYDTPGRAMGVTIAGDYAYIADYNEGLRVIAVADPDEVDEVGVYDTPGWAFDVVIRRGLVYIADGRGLCIVDVSDPTSPIEISYYNTPRRAKGVDVLGDYAYVTDGYSGLHLLDVSDPYNPHEVGSIDTPGEAMGVVVVGNYAYIADGFGGLRIIDVSNPQNPEEVGFYDTPGGARDVAATVHWIYVADGYSGMRLIDVSDPENPEDEDFFDTPGYAQGVAVAGNYCFIADKDHGLSILNVWEFIPQCPAMVLSPEVFEFGEVLIGEGADRILNIRNDGVIDLQISDIIDGEYFITEFDEEIIIRPGGSFDQTVSFAPQEVGEYEGSLTIISNNPGEETIVGLTGTGIVTPEIHVSPDTLNFGEVVVSQRAELSLTISNEGEADLVVSDVSIDGECFIAVIEEEITIEVDSSYDLTVTFAPEAAGEFIGSLTVSSNDLIQPELTVSLRGLGIIAPVMALSDEELNFDETYIGGNNELTLTILNEGNADLIISDVSAGTEHFFTDFFDEITIEPEEEHNLTISFSPYVSGDLEDELLITSNRNRGTVSLFGSGIAPPVSFLPDELDFDEVLVGSSRMLTVTIRNEGEEDFTLSDVTADVDYFSSNFGDDVIIEPDDEYNLTVIFTPEEMGEFTGILQITSDNSDLWQIRVALYGSGVMDQSIRAQPDTLDFNTCLVDRRDELLLTISNDGNLDLIVSDIFVVGDNFRTDFTDEIIIASESDYHLTVTFEPDEVDDYEGTLIITSDDRENEEITIQLIGSGIISPVITVIPEALDFGVVLVNFNCDLTLRLRNYGNADLTVSDVTIDGDYFSVDFDEELLIEPEWRDFLTITFAPEEYGSFMGRLTIISDDEVSEEVNLSLSGVCNVLQLRETGASVSSGDASGVDVSGDYAYLADGREGGLRVINISEPESPQEVAFFNTNGDAQNVTVAGDYAYVADGEEGLLILDISDPDEIEEIGSWNPNAGFAYNVTVYGDYAYLANGAQDNGFCVVDVSNPREPRLVGEIGQLDAVYSVAVRGDWAYAASGENGLITIDITDPDDPQLVGSYDYDPLGIAMDIAVGGNYGYLANADLGLRVVNITNPQQLQVAANYDTPGFARGIQILNNRAYVADELEGLRVIDVSNLNDIGEIGFYNTPGQASDLFLAGNYIYIADGDHGLRIIQIDDFPVIST